jgi:HSP20 family protein
MDKDTKDITPVVKPRFDVAPKRLVEMERMFEGWLEDFWSRPLPRLWRPDFLRLRQMSVDVPLLDVYEEKDDLVVKAEIPGLTKDEIDISIDGNVLTIKGEKKKHDEVKEENYYRCERTFGSFTRSLELPMNVKPDKVNAAFTDGVLEVRLPKAEEAKKNVIKVKVA